MKLLNFFKKFLGIYIAVVLLAILIFTPFVGYQFRRNYACDDIWILLAIALIVFLLYLLINKLKKHHTHFWDYIHSEKCFWRVLLISSIVMFVVQLFIACGGWFISGWDTRNVIFPDMQMNNDYMSMYPNQIFLAGLFRRIYFISNEFFGLDFYGYYFILVILSVVCVAVSVIFTGLIVKKFASPFIAMLSFLCAVLFLGFNPWIMIPYSDTFGMLCTTATLMSYCYIKKAPAKWFTVFFISIIGYSVKPTAIFVLFAILFVEFCFLIKNRKAIIKKIDKTKITKVCVSVLFALLGFGISSGIAMKVCDYGLDINEDRSFTATHFLMMGINLENHGGWNEDDVSISRSYDNVAERQAGNIKQWVHRLVTYGPNEIAFIFLNKTLTNFNDGSFAWEGELPWIIENRGNNPIVWAYFGIDPADAHNDNNNVSAYPRQTLWLMILIGTIFVFFNKKPKREEYIIYLTILAISGFLTVCEPDPRYLLLYTPFFVMVSVKGWQTVSNLNYKSFLTWTSKLGRKSNGK